MAAIQVDIDLLGVAAYDYFERNKKSALKVFNSYGEPENYPIHHFFRDYNDMPELEQYALSLCYGKTLDIGAGTGSHTIWMQENNLDVTAIDLSRQLINIQLARGVRQVIHDDVLNMKNGHFETAFLMMNGIGIAKDLVGLAGLLNHLKKILDINGQILCDSTDVSYLWEGKLQGPHYFGEVSFQYSYKNQLGNWFKWLYIDQNKLFEVCKQTGWLMDILYEEEEGRYLARLSRN